MVEVFFMIVFTLGAVALSAVRHQLHVLDRVHPVGHCPEQRVSIVDVDILVDGDADLAAIALEVSSALERAPDFGTRHAFLQRDHRDAQQPGQRFVQRHFLDALDTERIA